MKEKLFEIQVDTKEPVAGLQRIMALFSRNRIVLKQLLLKENHEKKYFEIDDAVDSKFYLCCCCTFAKKMQ